MCLVEVGEKKPDGTVAMQPRVVPACQTPAKDGTICLTQSDKARSAQQQTLEALLLNHPLDCPVCDKAGECMLQDFSYRYGRSSSRMIDQKNQPPNKDYIGEKITLFTDRCIMCSRCVRFTREISGTAELQVTNRGDHSEIDIFPGEPVNNKLAGNVVDLCPVGALCNKEFLYKQRVWFLKSQPGVCAGCSTGCSIHVDANKDIVYRLRPRENPQAQGWFMCDEGRFDYPYVNDPRRLHEPLYEGRSTDWTKLIPALRNDLAAAGKQGALAAVLSPMLTCEEAYLLAKLMKSLSPEARLYLGWVPMVGEDDHYPQDRKGRPIPPAKFTIRAEKCPNRRGVEEILRHIEGEVRGLDQMFAALGGGEIESVYLTAGYSPRLGPWISREQAQALKKARLIVLQDLFESAASLAARYVLPATTFAEKDGCFVNQANLAQATHWAVRPVEGARTEGQVFLDLLERRGLLHAETLRQELAKEVPFFAPLEQQRLGEFGVRLG
jgi:NADH-quinone oxidoreductase subunit G